MAQYGQLSDECRCFFKKKHVQTCRTPWIQLRYLLFKKSLQIFGRMKTQGAYTPTGFKPQAKEYIGLEGMYRRREPVRSQATPVCMPWRLAPHWVVLSIYIRHPFCQPTQVSTSDLGCTAYIPTRLCATYSLVVLGSSQITISYNWISASRAPFLAPRAIFRAFLPAASRNNNHDSCGLWASQGCGATRQPDGEILYPNIQRS